MASTPTTAVSVIRPTSRGAKRTRDRNGSTEAASPRSPQETLSQPGGSSSDSSPESRVNRRKCHKPQRVPQDFDNGESPADSVQESSRDTEDPHSSRNDTNESNHADEADDVEVVAEVVPSSVQPMMPMPSPFDFPLFNNIFFPTAQRLVEQQQRLGLPLSPLTPFYFLPRINPAQFDVNNAPEDLVRKNQVSSFQIFICFLFPELGAQQTNSTKSFFQVAHVTSHQHVTVRHLGARHYCLSKWRALSLLLARKMRHWIEDHVEFVCQDPVPFLSFFDLLVFVFEVNIVFSL